MSFEHLQLDRKGAIAVLRLASGKVNPLSVALVEDAHRALDAVEADREASALVLTGGDSRFFSYGLDVAGLLRLDRAALTRFFADFNRLLARLYLFSRPVAAAVNGHAMAGGLLLCLAADARVGAEGDYSLGLSEVKLGLAAPAPSLRMMARRLGEARTVDLALSGRILNPGQAVECGVLEDLVPPSELLDRAGSLALALADAPPAAIALNKQFLARGVYDLDAETRRAEDEAWIDRWYAPDAQERLRKLAERK